MKKKILIFRVGHIGDTYVILPLLKAIRKKYINDKIYLIYNTNFNKNTVDIKTILEGVNIVDEFIEFNNFISKIKLWSNLRKVKYDELLYLSPTLSLKTVLRDYIFFYTAKIKKLKYFPFNQKMRNYKKKDNNIFESELNRYQRIAKDIHIEVNPDSASIDFKKRNEQLQNKINFEYNKKNITNKKKFIINVHIGTKINVNNWGLKNWETFLNLLKQKENIIIYLTGSEDEDEINKCKILENISPKNTINFCGKLTINEINELYKKINLYIGHDTGLMHIAASKSVPILGIFSSRFDKGIWYPNDFKQINKIFYTDIKCSGCQLVNNCIYNKICIMNHDPNHIFREFNNFLTRYNDENI